MKQFIDKYSGLMITALLFIAVFLFWLHCYPQAMNFQEQNQLFLFSTDYLFQRIALPGGVADWLSELVVQFYYLPWLGALLLALIAIAIQRLILLSAKNKSLTVNILSLLPVVLLVGVMGDENVLLSYPIAILCVLTAAVCMRHMPWWNDFIAVPLLYWLFGPMTIVYVLLRIIGNPRKEWWTIIWLPAVQLLAYTLFIKEYPLIEVVLGINYYRIPLVLMMPKTLWIVPLTIVVLAFLFSKHKKPYSFIQSLLSLAVVIVCAIVGVRLGFPKDKYELLMQDYLVRQGKWQEIIDRAEHYQVKTAFSSNAVNLALGMTHQLADRQFTFYQSGEDALIMPMIRDNMSNFPSAEAFYQLGMNNSAKRYMYDIQESIINGRQSGRCMKRIAECLVIDGQYKVAQKYLDVLKQTLFYRQWANDASLSIKENKTDELVKTQRARRIKKNFLYDYSQIDKMLGQLVVENKDNKLALEYFLGQLLLKGDVKDFMGYLGWVMQQGAYAQMPIGYQDAVRCIQSHGTAPNSAYGKYIARKVGSRAQPE